MRRHHIHANHDGFDFQYWHDNIMIGSDAANSYRPTLVRRGMALSPIRRLNIVKYSVSQCLKHHPRDDSFWHSASFSRNQNS